MHIIYDIKNNIASELAGFGFWQLKLTAQPVNRSTTQNVFSNFRPGAWQFCWIIGVKFNSIQSVIVWLLHITQFTVRQKWPGNQLPFHWFSSPKIFLCRLSTRWVMSRLKQFKHTEAGTKWTPFRKRHFQAHFRESKYLNSGLTFTEVCS